MHLVITFWDANLLIFSEYSFCLSKEFNSRLKPFRISRAEKRAAKQVFSHPETGSFAL